MITKAQLSERGANEFHYGECKIGPRGGVSKGVIVRRGGPTKSNSREVEKFSVAIVGSDKVDEINQDNAKEFHMVSECPLESYNG